MPIRKLVALTALILPLAAHAQSDPSALEQLLKGKQFHLRNFSADPITHYTWDGTALTAPTPALRTFGVFIPTSVKLKTYGVDFNFLRGTEWPYSYR